MKIIYHSGYHIVWMCHKQGQTPSFYPRVEIGLRKKDKAQNTNARYMKLTR